MTDSKLTRGQVAHLLGVTPKTLTQWERSGRVPVPERDWRGWRLYDAAAVDAVRLAMGGGEAMAVREPAAAGMQVSARNVLAGVVKEITGDGVLCEVVLELAGGQEVVSVITCSSVERLGLKPGVRATALIKSTEVLLAR